MHATIIEQILSRRLNLFVIVLLKQNSRTGLDEANTLIIRDRKVLDVFIHRQRHYDSGLMQMLSDSPKRANLPDIIGLSFSIS